MEVKDKKKMTFPGGTGRAFFIVAVRCCYHYNGKWRRNKKEQTRSGSQFSFGFYLMSPIYKRRCWGRGSFYFLFLQLHTRKQTNHILFVLWGVQKKILYTYIYVIWEVTCSGWWPVIAVCRPVLRQSWRSGRSWRQLDREKQREGLNTNKISLTNMNGTRFRFQKGKEMFSNFNNPWAQKREKKHPLSLLQESLSFIQLVKSPGSL